MPCRVICKEHSSPRSFHYTRRRACAARLPASRGCSLSNTRIPQPSGRVVPVTPCLERTGSRHVPHRPSARHPTSHLPAPRLGHRRTLHHPDVKTPHNTVAYTHVVMDCQMIWVLAAECASKLRTVRSFLAPKRLGSPVNWCTRKGFAIAEHKKPVAKLDESRPM
jgi:hypothetical protein